MASIGNWAYVLKSKLAVASARMGEDPFRSFAVPKHEVGAGKEAQALWQEAHDLYAALNASAGVAESAARLALLARGDRDPSRSREWLSEASAAADATQDPETLQYIRDVATQLET